MFFSEEEVRKATLKYFDNDDLATDVWMSKYALKDNDGNFLEKTPDDMHKRLAKEFARIEKKYPNPMSEKEIYELFKNFKCIVPQGSPMFGIGNDYVNTSLSNCVVIDSPKDNVTSIFDCGKNLANLFKMRCGVGIDISTLRPEGAKVNNSAKSTSGAWTFADFYSYISKMIGQNGRRAALMISMDVRHLDIEKFIIMKNDLKKVTGANVSIKLTDAFIDAVRNDKDFVLQFPVEDKNPTITKKVSAKTIWEKIVNSAWSSAEPGILLWDNIINNSIADLYSEKESMFKTISTNPCGEIPLGVDSCRLLLLNVSSYVKNIFQPNAFFDYENFEKHVFKAQRLMDDLVDLEIEKLENIIKKVDTQSEKDIWSKLLKTAKLGRRTGLGLAGMGDAIAFLNQQYGSDKSIQFVEKVYKKLSLTSHFSSCVLAKERGAFPIFDFELENKSNCLYLKRIWENGDKIYELTKKYGRRNIGITTTAPAGSVSCLTRTSSGIEPVYLLKYTRRKKLNLESDDLVECSFVDEEGSCWQEYEVCHPGYEKWTKITGDDKVENSPYWKATSNDIDWEKSVDIQSAAQKWICHSISKTVNIPRSASKELISKIYMRAYEKGCKGITVYRDGCRSGVLIKKEEKGLFPQYHAPKRPKVLECDIHHMLVKGEKWTVLIGMLENKPYECLGGLSSFIEIPKKYSRGKLKKNKYKSKNNTYDLIIGENGSEFKIKDVISVFDNPDYAAFTRMISLGLRHGSKINYIVEQLQKDKDADMFSFAKCIARVLKTYIQDGTKVGGDKVCPECEVDSLVYKEGCVTCLNCGFSKCS